MKQTYVIHAEPRSLQGKGASRRLRREGKVPAILYGGSGKAVALSASHNELIKHAKDRGFFSQIVNVEVGNDRQQALVKDLQRHPARDQILHIDLQRVLADQLLRSRVQLEFVGKDVCPGIKTNGGVMEHHLIEIEIECLPKDLPESITVDVSAMDVDDVIRVSNLKLPEGVHSVALMHKRDPSVVAVHLPRAAIEAEEQEAAAVAAAAAAAGEGAAATGDAAKAGDAAKPAAGAAKADAGKAEGAKPAKK
ncbi:MAG TPA: 50S ribosomal protein L25/general stress protein Ctc [Nevskiaceae bacterium]|nr:50S ribosomal protein L25/general stress protein Ctc [Nevskiaceae bacterium]